MKNLFILLVMLHAGPALSTIHTSTSFQGPGSSTIVTSVDDQLRLVRIDMFGLGNEFEGFGNNELTVYVDFFLQGLHLERDQTRLRFIENSAGINFFVPGVPPRHPFFSNLPELGPVAGSAPGDAGFQGVSESITKPDNFYVGFAYADSVQFTGFSNQFLQINSEDFTYGAADLSTNPVALEGSWLFSVTSLMFLLLIRRVA
jgi:hypothetical protein